MSEEKLPAPITRVLPSEAPIVMPRRITLLWDFNVDVIEPPTTAQDGTVSWPKSRRASCGVRAYEASEMYDDGTLVQGTDIDHGAQDLAREPAYLMQEAAFQLAECKTLRQVAELMTRIFLAGPKTTQGT